MDKLQVIETSKGKPCALHRGYRYRLKNVSESEKTWVCSKEKGEKCRGRIKSDLVNNIKVVSTEHSCKPDLAQNEVQVCIFKAKKRAREEANRSVPMSSIYESEIKGLYDQGLDFVTAVPKLSSVKTILNRHRNRSLGIIKDPADACAIAWPPNIFTFDDGSTFLHAEDGYGQDKIVILGSVLAREALNTGETFFMDGTFKSCSKQFYQLYTIHVDIGSTQEETNIMPVIYSLLPNKKLDTHIRFIRLIKLHLPGWKPNLIKVDYEDAVIQTLRSEFPQSTVSGCNFHFNQCLWRKVQNLGLVEDYASDEQIRLHIRMCASLAHIPISDVEDGWLIIMNDSPNHPKITAFNDYFVETWLENPRIPIAVWNVHQQRHRTTNSVEGWHHRLNKLIHAKPNLFELIKVLKEESLHWNNVYQRQSLRLCGKRRKSVYVELDKRIDVILRDYNTANDLEKCLKTLSYIHKLQ